ncbi:MAG TPA: sigma-70 family RNA polymerase sigma factor [Spirochaetales bacterium]|nr:sigma-70 family RNA polymerase sigma factor [Spirochaetales bacterium]HRY53367.1 sigma-70 family RNA polymerase sigma factor [Spirochaetia bacterium]HRZ65241.1 sigma-70 family RNA polymerase sigma factor [Spirochaetia bacterium]
MGLEGGRDGLDDLEAIHRVLAGEREAFGPIVERYGARVLRFCRSRLGSDEEADDAAQEVFLRAYRSLESFRLGESFPAWLFSIAANRVRTRSLRRFADRAKAGKAAAAARAEPEPDPASEAERSLEAAELREAVARLPEEQRAAVELYYFAELSVAQAAGVLGIGEEALKSRLFRARARLRELVEGPQPGRGREGIGR